MIKKLLFSKNKKGQNQCARKSVVTFLLMMLTTLSVYAQQVTLKGLILDENSKVSVIGATIKIKGQNEGAVSDVKGNFSLKVKSFPVTLNVSIIGYKQQEIDVFGSDPITIFLAEDINLLNEVVVVGYGTQKRKELTGAISSVSKTHLEYNVSSSVDALLGGAVAGVNVTQSSGQPGSPASIRIRGGNSINASNDPLYVIDGFPYFSDNSTTKVGLGAVEGESNPLNLLNPSDIESIEVLKDVSATAIYGSRGSNGVILIATKKGKKGRNSVNYQFSTGWSKSAKKLDLLNASQWARLQKDYFLNKPGYTDAQIEQLGEGYDWQSAVLQTGMTQSHSLSISGGDEKSQYFLSGNYLNQEGIILNSGLERFTGKLNYDKEVFSGFKIGVNLTASKSTQNSLTTFEGVNYNSSPYSKGIANSLTYALYIPPVVPIYNSNNSYNYNNPYEYAYLREGSKTANPVSDLKNSTAQTINTAFLGNFYAQYKIIDGLTAKVNFGSNISHTTQNYFSPSYTAIGLVTSGIGGIGNKRVEVLLSEFTLAYTKQIGVHSFDILAGFTDQKTKINYISTISSGFTDEDLGVNNLQDGTPYGDTPIYSGSSSSSLYSMLGRINYSLLKRYNLTTTFRSDYSTRFAHRWGIFPSLGLSWNVNEEGFLKGISDISNLKLRMSFGSVGNQEIGDYDYLQTLVVTKYNGKTVYKVGNTGDDNLKWETTTQYNIGLDAGILNNRITATADAYYKKTSNLLLLIPAKLSEESGQLKNIGNVVNKGLELSVNAIILDSKKTNWSVAANISKNHNEITKLNDNGDIIDGINILRVGESLGSFYGLAFDGVVQKGEDVSKLPTTPANTSPQLGDPKFKDINSDGYIDANDRAILGSIQPDFIYGFSSTFKYHGFDLFVLLQGSHGNKVYNELRRYLETPSDSYNASAALLNAWTETNPSTTIPRITSVPISSELDSRYIEDASYLRIKTITLGYTINKIYLLAAKQPLKIRLFSTLENLVTITGYKGYDPEVAKGLDLGSYPMARTLLVGANISF
ncbi:TonB-dependent receptor [uncultured Bacteroides sp.]|uniref:SusC/RagA family TonB-linked outer membrane protein n=1 Tax=uncultured Bacteroides sp. TaxID=162156 RepID=UPI002AA8DD82|nr:TonB-dependent receptor [uncultured Bacteroides sp.]